MGKSLIIGVLCSLAELLVVVALVGACSILLPLYGLFSLIDVIRPISKEPIW